VRSIVSDLGQERKGLGGESTYERGEPKPISKDHDPLKTGRRVGSEIKRETLRDSNRGCSPPKKYLGDGVEGGTVNLEKKQPRFFENNKENKTSEKRYS